MQKRALIALVTISAACIVFSLTSVCHMKIEEFSPHDIDIKATLALSPASLTWRTDAIPKLIHQTAPSDRSKWPKDWEECQKSWRKHFPGYVYRLWTDEDIDKFMQTRYPTFYDVFKSYDRHIKRVDVFRYFVLYEFGGIYADMDYLCVRNFEHLLPNGKVSCNQGGADVYQNALIASPARHPFWHYVFVELFRDPGHQDVIIATGPHVLFRAHNLAPNGDELMHQLPAANIYKCDTSREDCYANHIETGVWKT